MNFAIAVFKKGTCCFIIWRKEDFLGGSIIKLAYVLDSPWCLKMLPMCAAH